MNVDAFANIHGENRFVGGHVIPAALFIQHPFTTVDHHHAHGAVAANGDIRRPTLQGHGFPHPGAGAFREDKQGVALGQTQLACGKQRVGIADSKLASLPVDTGK